ncbi:MAG: hypothetical protein H9533_11930 [Rhodobacteraceae bacterium]|jgi:hypothetical protein|nr:hypothetical protein [Paracoccaceae bacterium]
MFPKFTNAAVMTALLSLAAGHADAKQGMYGNVTAKDMYTLLAGNVFVRQLENADKHSAEVMTLQVTLFKKDGTTFQCAAYDGYVDGVTGSAKWKPVIVDDERDRERYPLLEATAIDGSSWALLNYDGSTGDLDAFAVIRGRWKPTATGHIQSDIPAAVYTMCPDFPSAESLGTRVNTKQTSTNYRAMVAQDPGARVLRPDLVSDNIPERY